MSPKTTCPQCGASSSGNFCSNCGAALASTACPSCGAKSPPDARFCTNCGTPLASGRAPAGRQGDAGDSNPNVAWWAAGGLLVIIILLLAWPTLRGGSDAPSTPAAPAGSAGAVDLSSMTPREAADALFDHVMRSLSAADTADAQFFVPMAVQAYENARPLDADGLYHLSLIHRTGGDPESALAAADEALATQPDYLLGLYAAAEAALDLGDSALAGQHYAHILEVWDAEMASGNQDYEAHATQMGDIRQEAVAFTGGG